VARWTYVADIRLPSERANTIQVLNQCQALIRAGQEVELIAPRRLRASPEKAKLRDLGRAYGLERRPAIRRLPSLDLTAVADRLPGRLSLAVFYLHHLSFLVGAAFSLALRRPEVVYSREVFLALLAGWLIRLWGGRLIVEAHNLPRGRAGRLVYRLGLSQVWGLVVISRGLKDGFVEAGLAPARLLVAPDGVAGRFFLDQGRPEELRRRLGLPREDPLVLYAGGLYWAWKGVATLIEAQRFLDDRAWLVVVGGSPEAGDLEGLKARVRALGLRRVRLTGFVPPARVPEYLQAADVLVLPNSAASEISRRYTSPLKLFEYLASGRPVAASDLPSLRETLIHGRNAWLVKPDDPAALAAGIKTLLDNPGLGRSLAQRGRADAAGYTWEQRAARLMGLLG